MLSLRGMATIDHQGQLDFLYGTIDRKEFMTPSQLDGNARLVIAEVESNLCKGVVENFLKKRYHINGVVVGT